MCNFKTNHFVCLQSDRNTRTCVSGVFESVAIVQYHCLCSYVVVCAALYASLWLCWNLKGTTHPPRVGSISQGGLPSFKFFIFFIFI